MQKFRAGAELVYDEFAIFEQIITFSLIISKSLSAALTATVYLFQENDENQLK